MIFFLAVPISFSVDCTHISVRVKEIAHYYKKVEVKKNQFEDSETPEVLIRALWSVAEFGDGFERVEV
jgi:hypothetical protein